MLTLIVTRHGLTGRSVPEQHLGQRLDVELSEDGRAQAAALGVRLASLDLDRVIASPLARARQTAEIIAASPQRVDPDRLPVEVDPRLAEMDYGAWEGLTYAEIEQRFGPERTRFEVDPESVSIPGGESGHDVARRVTGFLEDVLRGHAERHGSASSTEHPSLIVGHSSTNRILVCVALGIPVRDYRRRVVQSQVNLTALRWEGELRPSSARLLLLNDVSHVRTPPATPWE